MKNLKFFKAISIIAIIILSLITGFSLFSCGDGAGGGGGGGGGGSTLPKTSGSVTFSGLGSYEGKYIIAIAEEQFGSVELLLACEDANIKEQIAYGTKVSGGSVTLKVWQAYAWWDFIPDNLLNYKGNDKSIEFYVIANSGSSFGSSSLDDPKSVIGLATVNFSGGAGSGAVEIGAHYRLYPYKLEGSTLIFDLYGDYTPDDPECDRWTFVPGTGEFPFGKYENQHNNNTLYESVEYKADGYLIYYSSDTSNFTQTGNSTSGTFTIWGENIPYKHSNNTLIFNPMGRGPGFKEYTPDDPECDKWTLVTGTGGAFPVGKWAGPDNNPFRGEWIEFKAGNIMVFEDERARAVSEDTSGGFLRIY